MPRPSFFLPQLALAVGIGLPRQQRQAQRDDMRTDDAALHVVAAGAEVFAGQIRQNPGGGFDGPAAPRQRAAHHRRIEFRIQHQPALEQRLAVPEGDRPPQSCRIFCVIGNFTDRSRRFPTPNQMEYYTVFFPPGNPALRPAANSRLPEAGGSLFSCANVLRPGDRAEALSALC